MIELKQLIGKRKTLRGVVDVVFDTDAIIENGKRIGFVARHKGAPIALLRTVPQSVMTEIEAHVIARDGEASDITVVPQVTLEDIT